MIDYVEDLRATVICVAAYLSGLSDGEVSRRPAPGKWSTKEIVGHLIDSAANNHGRFVRAQFEEDLVCSGYAQEAWVSAQGYQEAPWPALVGLWREYNLHLAHVIERMPDAARLRPRGRHNLHEVAWQPPPAGTPVTLDYFMRDYVAHLHHHLRQIDALVGQSDAGT
jgi:hypothetical protein